MVSELPLNHPFLPFHTLFPPTFTIKYLRVFVLFGVRLLRLTAIIVCKVRFLNKDSLHMFSKILKWKIRLCLKYQVLLIKTIHCISLISLVTG